jgi:hypothetical protein
MYSMNLDRESWACAADTPHQGEGCDALPSPSTSRPTGPHLAVPVVKVAPPWRPARRMLQ